MPTVNEYHKYLCDYLGRLNGFIQWQRYSQRQVITPKERAGIKREISRVEQELVKLKKRS